VSVRRRFGYYLGVRLAAAWASARVRRGAQVAGDENRVDPVMLALWALSLPTLITYVALIAWWLLTGRGPGGKIVALELGALSTRHLRRGV
jgi:hypothetical protein